MKILIIIVFGLMTYQAQAQNFHADIRGTNDSSDGGMFQLATPNGNHDLRLFSGRIGDPKPYLYFHGPDTFRITSGNNDFSDFTENMTILNGFGTDGSNATFIGINNRKPVTELDIKTTSTNDGSEIRLGNSDDSHFLRLFSGRQDFATPSIYWKHGDSLSIGTSLNTYTERLRITSDGMVGIGLADPQARLGIKFDSGMKPHIDLIEDQDVDFARIRLRNRTNADFWDIAGNTTNSGLLNFFSTVGGDILSIKDQGRVGIRNSNPQAALHVSPSGGDDAAKFDGRVNFTDPILINGMSGLAGQVLMSNGSNDPAWITPGPVNPEVGFKAHLTSDVAVSSSTEVVLASFTENYDDGGNFNHTSGIFTAPSAGVYHFECMFSWAIGGTIQTDIPVFIRIRKNGNTEEQFVERVTIFTLIHEDQHYSTDLKLQSGDQISFVAFQVGGASMLITGTGTIENTKVSGHKIY